MRSENSLPGWLRPAWLGLLALAMACGERPPGIVAEGIGTTLRVEASVTRSSLKARWCYTNEQRGSALVATRFLGSDLSPVTGLEGELETDGTLLLALGGPRLSPVEVDPKVDVAVDPEGTRSHNGFERVGAHQSTCWETLLALPLHLGRWGDALEPARGLRIGATLPATRAVAFETVVVEPTLGADRACEASDSWNRGGRLVLDEPPPACVCRTIRARAPASLLTCTFEESFPNVWCFAPGDRRVRHRKGTDVSPLPRHFSDPGASP
jgi:hypothetical protein